MREADQVEHRRHERHGRAVVVGHPAGDTRPARRRRVGDALEGLLAQTLNELAWLAAGAGIGFGLGLALGLGLGFSLGLGLGWRLGSGFACCDALGSGEETG